MVPFVCRQRNPGKHRGHKGGRENLTKPLFQQYGQTLKQKIFQEKTKPNKNQEKRLILK